MGKRIRLQVRRPRWWALACVSVLPLGLMSSALAAPVTPTGLTATAGCSAIGKPIVSLAWSGTSPADSAATPGGWRVERSMATVTAFTNIAGTNAAARTFVDETPVPGVRYQYRLTSVEGGATSTAMTQANIPFVNTMLSEDCDVPLPVTVSNSPTVSISGTVPVSGAVSISGGVNAVVTNALELVGWSLDDEVCTSVDSGCRIGAVDVTTVMPGSGGAICSSASGSCYSGVAVRNTADVFVEGIFGGAFPVQGRDETCDEPPCAVRVTGGTGGGGSGTWDEDDSHNLQQVSDQTTRNTRNVVLSQAFLLFMVAGVVVLGLPMVRRV